MSKVTNQIKALIFTTISPLKRSTRKTKSISKRDASKLMRACKEHNLPITFALRNFGDK